MTLWMDSAVEAPAVPCEVVGPLDAPTILVLGGISANRHVCASDADPSSGWWESVAGRGRALDTERYRLVGVDYLDAGRGEDGRPAGIVTTHDQADAIAATLDEIGVGRVHAVIGASYGGMVALAFAERYGARVERLIVTGAAHRAHPMITAIRAIQRRIVQLGLETGRERETLVLARALAMTTYRSAREFAERFDVAAAEVTSNGATFPVERYLDRQGERFAASWTPHRYLALSLSSDLHAVVPSRIRARTTLIAAENDAVVPREQMEELARELGGPCRVIDLPSPNGHDAFLTEPETLGPILVNTLTESISS